MSDYCGACDSYHQDQEECVPSREEAVEKIKELKTELAAVIESHDKNVDVLKAFQKLLSLSAQKFESLVAIVEHQAKMESLWLLEPSLIEATMMAAIRHLHAVIEGDEVAAAAANKIYWDLESEM